MMRSTSSMRASLRSVVVPLFRSEAQSRATPAFFDDFTSIEPDRVVPPSTRRCIGALGPIETMSLSSAAPTRASMSMVRFWPPCSMRLTAL